MPTPFIMPKFDMDQETARVVEWLKKDGDFIQFDEPVLTVETDKVAIDVPAPASGKLVRISAKPGEVVPVTTVIAYILGKGETESDLKVDVPSAPATLAEAPQVPERMVIKPTEEQPVRVTPVAARMAQSLGIDLTEVPAHAERLTKADIEQYMQGGLAGRVSVPATPAARRLAGELQIDLAQVPSSGPQGRVQAADVDAFRQRLMTMPASTVPAASIAARADRRPAELAPLSGLRNTIAQRMQASFHDAPHIALTIEVDMTHAEATRQSLNELASRQQQSKLSVTALLVRMVAWALRRNPYINSSLFEETIYLWKDINIGVATAVPGGLIVPVIHNADQKPVAEINARLKDLSERARQGGLNLGDVKDGTFTISNLGMYQIQQFRAIINPPESAILAVGSLERRPVVIDDQDTLAVRPMLNLTLSADHRVIDGVTAAEFLLDLRRAIENPELMLY